MTVLSDVNVEVSFSGEVDERDRAYALDKLEAVAAMTTRPILAARLRLSAEPNPARERPAVVQGALDLDGQVARAQVAAPTMREAIVRFEERLRERVEVVEGRPLSLRLRQFRRAGRMAPRGRADGAATVVRPAAGAARGCRAQGVRARRADAR